MAYEFKNLNEVETQDKPTDNTTVMAFEGGVPKQIPAKEFSGVVLIEIPQDDPGWATGDNNTNTFDFNYDPIYDALNENRMVVIRPFVSPDVSAKMPPAGFFVSQWVLIPGQGLQVFLSSIRCIFPNGSHHAAQG